MLIFLWFSLFFCNNTGYLQGHKRPLEASRVLEEYAKVRKLMTFDVDNSLIHQIVFWFKSSVGKRGLSTYDSIIPPFRNSGTLKLKQRLWLGVSCARKFNTKRVGCNDARACSEICGISSNYKTRNCTLSGFVETGFSVRALDGLLFRRTPKRP